MNTVDQYWKVYEAVVEPDQRPVARVAFFAGYAMALNVAGRYEEAHAVMDVLREGKCG